MRLLFTCRCIQCLAAAIVRQHPSPEAGTCPGVNEREIDAQAARKLTLPSIQGSRSKVGGDKGRGAGGVHCERGTLEPERIADAACRGSVC